MRFLGLILVLGILFAVGSVEPLRKGHRKFYRIQKKQEVLPLFRSLNEFRDAISEVNDVPTTGADVDEVADEDDDETGIETGIEKLREEPVKIDPPKLVLAKQPQLMLFKTAAADGAAESGRTLKHLFLLKGLAGGVGSGSGSSSGGCHSCNGGYNNGGNNGNTGFTIPYIIINTPSNLTNINNNNVTNSPPAATGTAGTGGGRRTPQRNYFIANPVGVPLQTPMQMHSEYTNPQVYQQRQNNEVPPVNVPLNIPILPGAAMLNFGGDLIPLAITQSMPQRQVPQRQPALRRRQQNPFKVFANNLRGVEFL